MVVFSSHFITSFRQKVPLKNVENRSIFGEDIDNSLRLTFLAQPVMEKGFKKYAVRLFSLSQLLGYIGYCTSPPASMLFAFHISFSLPSVTSSSFLSFTSVQGRMSLSKKDKKPSCR